MKGTPMQLVDSPPPVTVKGNQRINWPEVAARLRENPGEWGRIDNVPKTTGTHIRQGKVAPLRPVGEWEVMIRRDPLLPPVRATLYIRWVGNDQPGE